MNIINLDLSNLKLKIFSEQDASDYCQINNINFNNITILDLRNNELTDISGVKLFKNLEYLDIKNNQIKDISVIQYLNKLEELYITNLRLESDQILYINSHKKLYELYGGNGFKDMSVLDKLNINIDFCY